MNIKRRKKAVTASTRKGATRRPATSITATVSYTPYKKKDLRTLEDEWGWESGELVSAVRDGERQLGAKFVGFTDDEDTYFVFKKGDDLVVYDSPEFGFWTPVEASTRKLPRRRILAADSDYIKIGNRILPRNTAGMRDEASYAEVSREGKRRYDAEQEEKRLAAEKEAKKQKAAEAIEKFNAIYPGDINESNLNDVMGALFDEFVPAQGTADTLAGEFIRAIERIRYRSYNDGDRFNRGYGLETCGPDAAFLAENTDDNIARMINDIAEHDSSWPDQYYDEAINNVAIAVVKYIADNLDLFGEDVEDSRYYESNLVAEWEEWSHNLEYDPDLSGEYLDRLMDADLIDWSEVSGFIDDCIMDVGGNAYWWAQDAVTITDLNDEEYDEWESNFDRWWAQWLDDRMAENAEALEEYENGYDEEDEEDEDEEE